MDLRWVLIGAVVATVICPLRTEARISTYAMETSTQDGKSVLNIQTQDAPSTLTTKLSLSEDGIVAEKNVLVNGGFVVRFDTPSSNIVSPADGDHIVVDSCPTTISLPTDATAADSFTLLVAAPSLSGSCAVHVDTSTGATKVDGWHLDSAVDPSEYGLFLVEQGIYQFTFTGSTHGWTTDAPVLPHGHLCTSFDGRKVDGSEPDQFYWIHPNGTDPFRTFCFMSQGSMTMIESISMGTQIYFPDTVLGNPSNAGQSLTGFPTKERLGSFRLTNTQMKSIQDATTRVRAICNMNNRPNTTHIQFRHDQVEYLHPGNIGDYCTEVESIAYFGPEIGSTSESSAAFIQNHLTSCENCQVAISRTSNHFSVRGSPSCSNTWTFDENELGSSYTLFGNYATFHWNNPCTSSGESTTDFFML